MIFIKSEIDDKDKLSIMEFQKLYFTTNQLNIDLSRIKSSLREETKLTSNIDINSEHSDSATLQPECKANDDKKYSYTVTPPELHLCKHPFCSYSCGGSVNPQLSGMAGRSNKLHAIHHSTSCKDNHNVCLDIYRSVDSNFKSWSLPPPMICER